jgi:autotransporter-associated beta strand protein
MLPIPPSVATNVIVRAVAIYVCGFLFFLLMCSMASAQTSYTSTTATTAWNAARWNNTADAAPYTSTFTANNAVSFTSGTYTFAGMGVTTNVGNVTVASGVTVNFASIGSTFATGGNVRTFNIGSGGLFDFQGQAISTAAGTGFIKSGDGVLALSGAAYTGGFTLNAGAVILRGVNAMGAGGALTLNGGTVAGSGNRDLTGKYTSITLGGNVQFGEMSTNVALANSTANLTFSNNMALGAATRTLTLGNGGNVAFGGVISNTSGGITFAATAGGTGRFDITNAANTFTGDITVTGGEVRFTADGSLGNATNNIIIDGGRFATLNAASYTLGAGRQIFVGDAAGTSISTPGAGVLTYNAAIADKSGETGTWAKQGAGTLALGGVSTYTGDTAINNGTVQLTTGNDRLPTTTTVSLGQAASANLGILDLNGRNQQIAGLNSVTGTNATATNNTVTSSTAATLTLGGSGSYSYGDGTDANSGVITGSITLVKSGGGTQTFGEANTYTGKTSITGGFIAGSGESVFGTNPGSFSADQITLNGGGVKATGNIAFNSNRGITLGSGGGTLDTNGSSISLTNEVTGSGLLTKQGAGTLTLNSANTHSGGVTVTAGTVAVKNTTGSATGSGDVTVTGSTILGTGRVSPASGGSVIFGNAAILSVGDAGDTSGKRLIFTPASGTMNTTFQSGSVVEFDLFTGAGSGDNSGIGTAADALQWGGTLALQSNVKLRVNNPNNMTAFAEGDIWKVLDWTTIAGSAPSGTFEASMLELPTLTGLLGWDTSNLYTAGTIGIIQVPEPSRAVLMLGGLMAAVVRRRR